MLGVPRTGLHDITTDTLTLAAGSRLVDVLEWLQQPGTAP